MIIDSDFHIHQFIHAYVRAHLVMSDSLQHHRDCRLSGSSVHGILQARIVEWVAIPPPGIFPTQGSNLCLYGSCTGRQAFYPWSHLESPCSYISNYLGQMTCQTLTRA